MIIVCLLGFLRSNGAMIDVYDEILSKNDIAFSSQ